MSNDTGMNFMFNEDNIDDKNHFEITNNSYFNTPKYDFLSSHHSCFETNLNSEYSPIYENNNINEKLGFKNTFSNINQANLNDNKGERIIDEHKEIDKLKNDLNLMNYSNAIYNYDEVKNNINAMKYGHNRNHNFKNNYNKLENEEKNLDIKSINSYHSKENSVLGLGCPSERSRGLISKGSLLESLDCAREDKRGSTLKRKIMSCCLIFRFRFFSIISALRLTKFGLYLQTNFKAPSRVRDWRIFV